MATLAKIKFGYDKKMTPAEQQRIQDLAFTHEFNVSQEDQHLWQPVTMLIEDAIQFGRFEVIQILQYHIIDRISSFQQREMSQVNQRCNVIVPGLGTLTIDTVKVMRDCCTDELQSQLEKGWKIVAVCVQPDQRRPDYILGKTNAD